MYTITDCGCYKHQSRKVTFDGSQATLMANFVFNLPMNGGNYTYICDYGHTHRIILHPSQVKPTSPFKGCGYTEHAALEH